MNWHAANAGRPTLLLLLTILLLSGSPTSLASDDHMELYKYGLIATHEERWGDAVAHLQKSLELAPSAETAYLLSVSWAQLFDHERALRYAEQALQAVPELDPEYQASARAIAHWAAVGLLTPPRIRATFTMSAKENEYSREIVSGVAEKEAEQAEVEELRSRIAEITDLDAVDFEVKLLVASDPCSGAELPEQKNRCLRKILNNEDFDLPEAPESPLPSKIKEQ